MLQRATASGQRTRNTQPEGDSRVAGASPSRVAGRRGPLGSGLGWAAKLKKDILDFDVLIARSKARETWRTPPA